MVAGDVKYRFVLDTRPRITLGKGRRMSTLFTRIINGEIPGRFVWREDDVVAFLTMGPLADGHTLVVPREEVDRWTDASAELLAGDGGGPEDRRRAGRHLRRGAPGLIMAGYEVDHLHVHVWPSNTKADFDFSSADHNPDPARLDANAEKLRDGLRKAGHRRTSPEAGRGPLRRRQRLVQRRADPLLGDRVGRSQFDGEEAHPELLDHPADLG